MSTTDTVEEGGFEWQRTEGTFDYGVAIFGRVAPGPVMYAVFDGSEKVSPEFGPLDDEACIWWAEGYVESNRRYIDGEWD